MKKNPLLPIFLIVLVDILGLTIILPLLPFYAEQFGATPDVIGYLVATYAVCQLVAGPILGQISDTTGRKPLLIVSQAGTFIGFLILASAGSLWVIFLSRIVDGLTAGNLSLAQAYISDVTPPEKRAASFGVIGIAFGIGFLLGPALSGYMSQFGYAVPILIAAGLSFTSILATTFLLPGAAEAAELRRAAEGPVDPNAPPPPAGRRLGVFDWGSYAEYFRRPELGKLLLQFFLFAFSFAMFTSGFALFAERRFLFHGRPFGTKEVGYVFAYVGFLGILLQGGAIRPLVKRFGEKALVLASFLFVAVAYVGLGASHSVPLLLVCATFSAIGNGLIRPAVTSLITRAVGRHEQGVVLGLTQSLMSVGQIFAPIIGTHLIDQAIRQHVEHPGPANVDHPEFLLFWACAAAAPMALGLFISFVPSR